MSIQDILNQRLISLQLPGTKFKKPEQLLHWFGGMQAQDYAHGKWALGVRLPAASDTSIEKALLDKKIIRTWLMRNTLHLATAKDVHWMLSLLAPRLIKASAGRYRNLELDEPTFKKTNNILTRALRDGKQLNRAEITNLFEKAGIQQVRGLRLAHILQRAVLEKLICQGSKQTFMLLDVPANSKTHHEALAELAARYFQSHGPATLADFTWWSGLTATEAKQALQMISGGLESITVEKHTYWISAKIPEVKLPKRFYLLPGFDEYVVGYKNRELFLPATHTRKVITVNGLFNPTIVIDGEVVGTWSRTVKKDMLKVQLYPFHPLTRKQREMIMEKAIAYGKFMDLAVEMK